MAKRRRPTMRDIEKAAAVARKFGGNLVATTRERVIRECGGDAWLASLVIRGARIQLL